MPSAQDERPTELGRDLPVGRVLRVRLLEQVAALRGAERSIRSGDDEGVHDSRVACRRDSLWYLPIKLIMFWSSNLRSRRRGSYAAAWWRSVSQEVQSIANC